MMRLFLTTCLIVGFTTLLVGCSSTPSHKKATAQHLTVEQIKEFNQKAMQKVSERLKELAIAAKSSGDDKVQYLASDVS